MTGTGSPGGRLLEAVAGIADTLGDGFEVAGFLRELVRRCVEILDVDAAGVLLPGEPGWPPVVVGTDERARRLEMLELRSGEGPCVTAFRTGAPVRLRTGPGPVTRWPVFAAAAAKARFTAVDAVPMRLRGDVIGALGLFHAGGGPLPADRRRIARTIAGIATIGLLQQRAISRKATLAAQLEDTLSTRVVVEQAKGFLAERLGVDVATAFAIMRRYARSRGVELGTVARSVIEGRKSAEELSGLG
ncbi:GAF and ANTAR domain-containing protein [Amycolatopsis saalfeldensis]|uniref:GAF domain-containing protein n=1 Tax=Amycolatopsis saalfeldensis TaxID=394193 RepID=A0A1H8YLL3_9PSEU|nr:GAF and ANTAR domain-containing protein [Amycolatopsis saalfeldensis]SEP53075.1 GAF domain-containing protein [Amycolatopsis saalfeldensis]